MKGEVLHLVGDLVLIMSNKLNREKKELVYFYSVVMVSDRSFELVFPTAP